jgi:hypothetical protein
LVKNDNKKNKDEFNNLSFDSESQKEYLEEEAEAKQSLFKFNKKKEEREPADKSEFLDAKLNYIQNNKQKPERKKEVEVNRKQEVDL